MSAYTLKICGTEFQVATIGEAIERIGEEHGLHLEQLRRIELPESRADEATLARLEKLARDIRKNLEANK